MRAWQIPRKRAMRGGFEREVASEQKSVYENVHIARSPLEAIKLQLSIVSDYHL